ncbi:MAG: hypothetical protein RBR12_05250 [Sulfurospirillum cavolei]|nr:hypothetical protein [Sulfurospirillum cavolei]
MEIFELYKTSGIDLSEHNGAQFYALAYKDALALLDVLEEKSIMLHSIDVLRKNHQGRYEYTPIAWDFDANNTLYEERYALAREKMQTSKDKEALAFLFSDEYSYKIWRKQHEKWAI